MPSRTKSARTNFILKKIFHVAMRLFSNRSHMTSKCGKNKTVARVSLMFLPHFDVILTSVDSNIESANDDIMIIRASVLY